MRNDLVAKRDAKLAEAKAVIEVAEVEGRDITDAELASVKEAREAADALDARISEIDAIVEAESRAAKTAHYSPAVVTSEPSTYRKGGETSYFRDLFAGQVRGDREALDRLARNDKEVRAINTTDGGIGEFVPPMWLVADYIGFLRAGRVSADLLDKMPLPAGTDSISIPKISTGATATGQASGQNTGFSETNLASTSVTSSVKTLGGIQIASVQLIEQSPVNMDQVILKDIAAAHAQQIDVFALTSNTTGQYGVLYVPSANTVTYTDGSPAVTGTSKFWGALSNAVQKVHSTRFAAPTAIVMHPRRWAWILAGQDSTNRPLVTPAAGRFNQPGQQDGVVSQGYVGEMQGISVYVDANIPTNIGAATNQDTVLVMKADDVILWESTPKFEVFRETYANQGSVLFRGYNYVAIASQRYPQGIATINGTGLVDPWA